MVNHEYGYYLLDEFINSSSIDFPTIIHFHQNITICHGSSRKYWQGTHQQSLGETPHQDLNFVSVQFST